MKVFKIELTLECPSDWTAVNVQQHLRKVATDKEVAKAVILEGTTLAKLVKSGAFKLPFSAGEY